MPTRFGAATDPIPAGRQPCTLRISEIVKRLRLANLTLVIDTGWCFEKLVRYGAKLIMGVPRPKHRQIPACRETISLPQGHFMDHDLSCEALFLPKYASISLLRVDADLVKNCLSIPEKMPEVLEGLFISGGTKQHRTSLHVGHLNNVN